MDQQQPIQASGRQRRSNPLAGQLKRANRRIATLQRQKIRRRLFWERERVIGYTNQVAYTLLSMIEAMKQ